MKRYPIFHTAILMVLMLSMASCFNNSETKQASGDDLISVEIRNPFIPGYYADPSLVKHDGKYYLYATIDPWGSYELAVWESTDFQYWTLRRLNWPTIVHCASDNSNNSMVSAPSVVRGHDGFFYMYVLSGGELWAGKSEHPLGPWYNLLPNQGPLITNDPDNEWRTGSAECLLSNDGRAFLFWGNDLNWKKGKCMAAELGPDMHSFLSEPHSIALPHFFEAPFVFEHNNLYYMLFADGRCNEPGSSLWYAWAEHPLGPWTEGAANPLVKGGVEGAVSGPGNPTVLKDNEQLYLIYHRIVESKGFSLLRQICIDSLHVHEADRVLSIRLPGKGVEMKRKAGEVQYKAIEKAESSSRLSEQYPTSALTDGQMGSLWVADDTDISPSIHLDLGSAQNIQTLYLWPEYGLSPYQYLIEYSVNSTHWKEFAHTYEGQERGSPNFHTAFVKARYLRITFYRGGYPPPRPALWEIAVE